MVLFPPVRVRVLFSTVLPMMERPPHAAVAVAPA